MSDQEEKAQIGKISWHKPSRIKKKEQRKESANVRQKEHNNLNTMQKIEKLDQKLGPNKGAKKERARLKKDLEKEEERREKVERAKQHRETVLAEKEEKENSTKSKKRSEKSGKKKTPSKKKPWKSKKREIKIVEEIECVAQEEEKSLPAMPPKSYRAAQQKSKEDMEEIFGPETPVEEIKKRPKNIDKKRAFSNFSKRN